MKKMLLLIVMFASTFVFSQNATEIAKNCLPSTVFITMEDEHHQPLTLGSGFIVEKGVIATNLHVIEGASFGHVFLIGNDTKHKINGYFAIDEDNDLALLSVPTITGKALSLFEGDYPQIGERIYAIGNPKGLSGTISEGIVSGIRTQGGNKLIQITAPISPGSSGGPVINNDGKVIGVAVGAMKDGQNLNFAIPSALIMGLLNSQDSTVSSLNARKSSKSVSSINGETDISTALEIRNINKQGIVLAGFTLINKIDVFVHDIKILVILYDVDGIPLDYYEKEYFTYPDGIRPYLARYISYSNSELISKKALKIKNNKFEIRIIDFKISDD